MEQKKLGMQGLNISAQGLGCMGMSDFYGVREDQREAKATIGEAVNSGINFFDTADMYGPFTNELLVGETLKSNRAEIIIATKFGFIRNADDPAARGLCGRPDYVRQACEASLERLQTDWIDLYYQHRVDPEVPIEDSVGEMSRLVEEGKVRFIGLSEVGPVALRKAHATFPVSAVQSEYSLWSRDVEQEVLPVCRELGIGFVAYSPLGRGFLTGQIKTIEDLPAEDVRRGHPRFQGENFARNLQLVEMVSRIAQDRGCSPTQLALAWVHAQGPDVIPIPGTKRRKYLSENIGALDVKLTPSDLEEIETIFKPGVVAGERYPAKMMAMIAK